MGSCFDYRIDERDTCHDQTRKENESRPTAIAGIVTLRISALRAEGGNRIVLLSMDSPEGERPQSATQKWLNQSSGDWIGAMYVFPFWLSPVDHPALSHANEKEPKARCFLGLTFFLFVGGTFPRDPCPFVLVERFVSLRVLSVIQFRSSLRCLNAPGMPAELSCETLGAQDK